MDHDQKVEEETFEATTWRDAVHTFTKSHKPEDYLQFLQNYSTPDETKKQVASAQKTAGSKYSGIVGKFMEKMDIFLQMGDLAIKAAPESIGLAWTGIRLCLNATHDDYETFQLYTGACTDIVGIMISCRVYGKSYSYKDRPLEFNELHEKVLGYIGQAYQNILEFSFQMWKYSNEHTALRIAKGLVRSKKAIVKSAIDAIHADEEQMNKFAEQASRQTLEYYQQQGLQNDQTILGNLSGVLEILQNMAQMKQESVKSGMELAQETLDELNKLLAPPVAMEEKLSAKITGRKKGTCAWILESDFFTKFESSSAGNATCLLGGAGSGKSFLMAAMIEHMREMADDDNSILIAYFFITRGSEPTTQPRSIARNLLSQIYRTVRSSFELIDDCNALMRKYLQEKQTSSKSTVQGQKEQVESELQQIIIDVAKLIGKRIYFFVDALDECTDGQPQTLVNALQTLVQTVGINANIFYSSRNDGSITSLLGGNTLVNVSDHTAKDIVRIVKSEIDELPGLTPSERELVCDEVTRKAGPSFNYVRLAMDFMRRPWRRPLSTHLKTLPEGIDSMYSQSITQTDPIYKDLLATCLTWTLLSARPLTVREMMDIYQETYVQDGAELENSSTDEQHDLEQYETQIVRASSAFLRIEKNKTIVTVHTSVREYFQRAQKTGGKLNGNEKEELDCQCKRCVLAAETERAVYVADIPCHIQIITTILRHLLSKSFRDKYYQSQRYSLSTAGSMEITAQRESSSSRSGGVKEINRDRSESRTSRHYSDNRSIAEPTSASNGAVALRTYPITDFTNSATPQTPMNVDEAAGSPKHQRDGDEDSEDSGTSKELEIPSDSNSDKSSGIEKGKYDTNNESGAEEELSYLGDSDDVFGDEDRNDVEVDMKKWAMGRADEEVGLRYETHNLIWHLVQLENLYPWHERSGKDWKVVESLLLEFMDAESESWKKWIAEVSEYGQALQDISIGEYRSQTSIQPLHVAAFAGLTSLVHLILQRSDTHDLINIPMNSGRNALYGMFTCQVRTATRQDELLRTLLSYGANPNGPETGRLRRSPFIRALGEANVWSDQIKLLLDHGAKLIEEDGTGHAAIGSLCEGLAGLPIAKVLFEAGADVNQRLANGRRPMHLLMERENFPKEMVLNFIERGAEIDVEDDDSMRPLRCCAASGHCEGLALLLDHGAEIDDEDYMGRTALHTAAVEMQTEAVRVLLDRGADPTRLDLDRHTPLHLACQYMLSEEAVILLIQAMVDRHSTSLFSLPLSHSGKTPLMKCVARGFENAVKLILDNTNPAEQLGLRSNTGRQALHFIATRAQLSMTRLLLERGAAVSSKDKNGLSPLQLCYLKMADMASEDRESIIVSLIEHDVKTALADTGLLHSLVMYASSKTVEKLLEHGVDPFMEDPHGWTMLQLAEQYQRTETYAMLLKSKRAVEIRPTKLVSTKASKDYILSADGLNIERPPIPKRKRFHLSSLMTDHPIPAYEERYYFEMALDSTKTTSRDQWGRGFSIGLCSQPLKSSTPPLLGYYDESGCQNWAYHSSGGQSSGRNRRPQETTKQEFKYARGDTVGCAVEPKKGTVFWTRNGKRLCQVAFDDARGRLFPVILLANVGKARLNFGSNLKDNPFMWEPGNRLDFDSDIPSASSSVKGDDSDEE